MTEETISEGDDVLLYVKERKTYMIRVEEGKSFHTHKGYVNHDDIIGRPYGSAVVSNLGFEFRILKPMLRDYIMKSARQTQITYPKDIALIVIFSGIGPGSRVVEAGTGTGVLTMALAFYVKPKGKIFSYEVREPFLDVAEKNLRRAKLWNNVKLRNKDITEGIDECEVDAVILDLATPWLVVPHAHSALKPSGTIVSFSPTMDQIVNTTEALNRHGYVDIETVECLVRGMQVERGRTRPQTLMTAHTGYITYARKTTPLKA
jgi:tRNA (adenine57-N1/adenine58-N1)-methyltransferase